MITSPKVATYDLQPEMSAQGVADKVAEVVREKTHDFIMCNFAPPDMVGHTGIYEAAVKAITATDAAVKTIYDACEEAGYVLVVTADHGNAEQMLNAGKPHTAHTTNPVPFIVTGGKERWNLKEDTKGLGVDSDVDAEVGALCDVAPTILDIMGLDVPKGESVLWSDCCRLPLLTCVLSPYRNVRPLASATQVVPLQQQTNSCCCWVLYTLQSLRLTPRSRAGITCLEADLSPAVGLAPCYCTDTFLARFVLSRAMIFGSCSRGDHPVVRLDRLWGFTWVGRPCFDPFFSSFAPVLSGSAPDSALGWSRASPF